VGNPVVDSRHLEMEGLAKRITRLCFSREFGRLRNELEQLYQETGNGKSVKQAFQDALYTLMVQEEIKVFRAKAQD